MGSQFVDIWVADPSEAHAIVRGDRPEFFERDHPPELAPALAVMREGTFCFLPKGKAHAQGLVYCRAFELVLAAIQRGRWTIECYPDDSSRLLQELAFGRCEAAWLTLPHARSGVGVTAWRSPRSARWMADMATWQRNGGEFEPRFVSAQSLTSIAEACEAGSRSDLGIFTIYQA